MILGVRQQKPLLEFELGETSKIGKKDDVIRVFLTNTFPANVSLNIETELPFEKITDNIWDVTYDGVGSKNIVLVASTEDKSFEKYSNKLTITDK